MPWFLSFTVVAAVLASSLVAVPLLRQGRAAVTAVVLALGLPAGALSLYLAASNYGWSPAGQPVADSADIPDLAAALARLEARLQAQPDDRDGWLLLGNTYLQLQRPAEAEGAFAKALRLSHGEDPVAKLGLAEAMTLQNRDALAGDAGAMFEEVLAAQPDNAKALWYGGLVALARGDRPTVQARWERLLQQPELPGPVSQAVIRQLQALGFDVAAAPTDTGGSGTAIDVHVSVSAALKPKMSPEAMLFLIARDGNAQAGPPVAAVRQQAAGLPRTVRISDANAMLAGRNLSQLQNVRLVARVSNGGGAMAQAGDVFGEATWSPGQGRVSIVMDQLVEP